MSERKQITSFEEFQQTFGKTPLDFHTAIPLLEIAFSFEPLTRRARWRSRCAFLGEWLLWRALVLAPRYRQCVEAECYDRYHEKPPKLRQIWRPWKR